MRFSPLAECRRFAPVHALAACIVLVVLLGAGLRLDMRKVPPPSVDRPAPAFVLPLLGEPQRVFSPAEMRGQVWVLNVWASWCGSCRDEHPLLLELARSKAVPLLGLNYRDGPQAARAWLKQFGDPYGLSVTDGDGRIGIDYGVRGVPETYVIDRHGVIRYRRTGPITREVLERTLRPLVRELQG